MTNNVDLKETKRIETSSEQKPNRRSFDCNIYVLIKCNVNVLKSYYIFYSKLSLFNIDVNIPHSFQKFKYEQIMLEYQIS